MNRREFSKIALAAAVPLTSFKQPVKCTVRLIRHATLIVKINHTTLLIDPMLSPKGAMDPVSNAGNDIRIPMVDLPVPAEDVLKNVDAVFVTHTHRDHWDAEAQKLIDKSKPIFCQPADFEKISSHGFTNVTPIEDKVTFNGITIYRTGGQHGTGEIGGKMGVVSGFVFDDQLYVAGDTIWCDEVGRAIQQYNPKAIVVNAGGAQFLSGDPITMNESDVKLVSSIANGNVIAVHMNTINHCKVTSDILKKFVAENNLKNVIIPADGETLAS